MLTLETFGSVPRQVTMAASYVWSESAKRGNNYLCELPIDGARTALPVPLEDAIRCRHGCAA
jgi:hypothetical protein